MRKIFTENLPKKSNNDNRTDYKNSEGLFVNFIYDDINGKLKIDKYLGKDGFLVEYDTKQYRISKQGFINCSIGYIVIKNKNYNSYKYNVGYEINNMVIIKQTRSKNGKRTCKGYDCQCLKCGKEFNIREYDIDNHFCCKEKNKRICFYCSSDNNVHTSSIDNKDYCQKHYQQLFKYKELKIEKERKVLKYSENQKCKVDGCYNKVKANGYCVKHYSQLRLHDKIFERTTRDLNEIIKYDDYAEIILYNKNCKEIARTRIDLEDIKKVQQYKWCVSEINKLKYVQSRINGKLVGLGNFLLNKSEGVLNYKDKDTLNNRKNNLRIVDRSKNGMNCRIKKNNTSGFTGVFWSNSYDRWVAQIKINRTNIRLGSFKNKDDAINARIQGELFYFGEYSKYYE